jgi:hypothetical protein
MSLKHFKNAAISLGAVLLLGTMALAATAPAPAKATLQNNDCVKCHSQAPADVEAAGMAHKTAVSCQDCHNGHPPAVKKIIPQCSQCHEGKAHYKLEKCMECHKNPHQPKNISFGKNLTDPCLTCHVQQIAKLRETKSKHSALYCTYCHDVHGKIPSCTQCHKGHSPEMTQTECKKCHEAHKPTAVAYGNDVPNKQCGACHSKADSLLAANKSKHNKLLCVSCHQAKHKMVPKCVDCHGTPHPAGMLSKFPRCQDCHNIAHDVNNWSAVGGTAPAAAPQKKK